MGKEISIIETGIDKLVNLINIKEKISPSDAATELGVGSNIIMEWADYLEEEGIIKIQYKFTKPFLVARKIAKKDVQIKAKEFSGKKEVFVRKAEVSLIFLNREASKLKGIKDEFDKIKKELGLDIDSIKNELMELQKYEKLKINLDKQIEQQKTDSMDKLQEISQQILRERRKYQDILEEIEEEEEILQKDRAKAISLEESEKLITERLDILKIFISKIEAKAKAEEEGVLISERNIQRLNLTAKSMKTRIEKEKRLIEPLVLKSQNQTYKIKALNDTIVKKIKAKEKKLSSTKKASTKMQAFFKKKLGILGFIEKVNKDRNELERELIELIKKAKSFELSSKSADMGEQIMELEEKFKGVDDKKHNFEKELKKLSIFFK